MPDLPVWYRKINDIRADVESSDVQLYTRRSIETLFGIKKSAAAELMHRIGGSGQVAHVSTVSRRHLLLFLYKVQDNPGYQNEVARRENLVRKLEAERKNLSARRHVIAVERAPDVTIDGLAGVTIHRGRLTVDFYGTEDLLRKLYELSQAIVQDWHRFERLAEDV